MTASGPIKGKSSFSNLIALLRPLKNTMVGAGTHPSKRARGNTYHVHFVHWIHLQSVPPDGCFLDILELYLLISLLEFARLDTKGIPTG